MIWLHGSFNFYLITFYLKYFPGNIFVNAMCFASADMVAYLSSGLVLKYLKIRQGLAFSYSFALIGSIIYLCVFSIDGLPDYAIPAIVAVCRVGGSMSFNIGYVSVSRLFPTEFTTTVFGVVNLFSHLITIGAPVVAETSQPIPMVVFAINSGLAIIFGWQLIEYDTIKAKQLKEDNTKKSEAKKKLEKEL